MVMSDAVPAPAEQADDRAQYLKILQIIVERFKNFSGQKAALSRARKAPLDIDADGNVTGFYGEGEKAIDVLSRQYEAFMGVEAADRKIRKAMVVIDNPSLLPERLRPRKQENQFLDKVLDHLHAFISKSLYAGGEKDTV